MIPVEPEPSQRYKELVGIAVPATLSSMFVLLIIMIDTKMVAPLGTAAISAVTIATQPELMLFLVFSSLGTAATVVVSRAFGRKSRRDANAVLIFTTLIALGAAVVLGVVAGAFAWPIMVVLSSQADTMDASVAFFRILLIGMVFQAMSNVICAALRGVSDAKATLVSNVVAGIVDVVLDYLLIEGHLGFPAWGVAGAAWATTIGYFVGFVVSVGFLLRKDSYLSLRFCRGQNMRITRADARDIWKNTSNVFCETALTRVGFMVSGMVVARLGSYETSVYAVGTQLLSFSFVFGDGVQSAVLALVGKGFGAKDFSACKACVRDSLKLGLGCAVVVAVLCVAFGGPFFSFFQNDADFSAAGGVIGVFVAVIAPFQINRVIRASVLRACGDVKTPRRIATLSALVVDPPLSLLFAIVLGWGQWGLWTGTLLSQLVWFALAHAASRKLMARFDDPAAWQNEPDDGGGLDD